MAKSQVDMIRDILNWQISSDNKLALIKQVVGAKSAPTDTVKARVAKKAGKKKAASGKRAATGFTEKARLWRELKRLAPDRASGLNYTEMTTEKLESMVQDAKKG